MNKELSKQNKKKRLEKRLNQFIQNAHLKHGNKYDYSMAIYYGWNSVITIICNTCKKSFKQKMWNHLNGSECCPICFLNSASYTPAKTTKRFSEEAKLIHGNKYDYTKTIYKNGKTKLEITCTRCHKSFWQYPYDHLGGKGCQCYSRFKICLKDGTLCDSLAEAYHYLLLKKQGLNPKCHGIYGGKLGQRLYDFYVPEQNKYIEITGFNKNNYKYVTGESWISYLRNIIRKKQYAKEQGYNFEFIQYNKLNLTQRKYIALNVAHNIVV